MASTETATPTATQTAALNWVYLRGGKRPSTTALRLLVDRGWTTSATKDAELTDAGRQALGLDPVTTAPAPAERADTPTPAYTYQGSNDDASTGFVDSLGAALAVGDRIMVAAKGNNVRAKDVGQLGTVTGASRTRVKVTWDATEDAPWKAILPALVTRQG